MKKTLLVLLLSFTCFLVQAQAHQLPRDSVAIGYLKVVSTYDTTVLFNGIDTIFHPPHWVYKDNANPKLCPTTNDPTGCPGSWLDEERICTICLQYEHIVEKRQVVYAKDEFEAALQRMNTVIKSYSNQSKNLTDK